MCRMLDINPSKRLTISGLLTHPWCMTWVVLTEAVADPTRPSQLSREQIPEALTQGMRASGMMAVADPTFKDPNAAAYAAS